MQISAYEIEPDYVEYFMKISTCVDAIIVEYFMKISTCVDTKPFYIILFVKCFIKISTCVDESVEESSFILFFSLNTL